MFKHRRRQNRKPILDESGFTLLEIIAVLVILSIMAVVAVPKYFDLQQQAKDKSIKTALAEGIGRMNGYFAEQVLGGTNPTDVEYTIANLGADLGDFTMEILPQGDTTMVHLKVTGNDDTVMAGETADRLVPKPGF